MALEPAKLSEFAIAGALGAGTTAKVYDAVHTATGRPVAIKMLQPSQQAVETRERFAREALLLAGVESRHIGKILGFGFERGGPFLVLERLCGETLDAKLRRDGPVPAARALRWFEQLIVGLRDCHDANIIHRDIKPSNIFLHETVTENGAEEIVKVIDFGVARLKEVAGDPGLTSTQALIGSMGYMAPEQFRDAKAVDFTADIYAVGVVVFRALTGRLPFVSRSLDAVIRMKLEQAVPLLSAMPGAPQNPLLDAFVQRAMAREPRGRFQSAREMLEAWWAVMGSFDEEVSTDVIPGAAPSEEPYAGSSARRTLPDTVVVAPADEEERTLRRPPPLTSEVAAASAAESSHPSYPPFSEPTLLDVAPVTLPGAGMSPGDGGERPASLEDLWDMPTKKNDPSLRKLVERELELQRRGKRRG